jgi:raffinose/stachyose/melibiose transport system permease protein
MTIRKIADFSYHQQFAISRKKGLRVFSRYKYKLYIIYFLAPAVIFVSTFFLMPSILNFTYAFTDWNTFNTEVNFLGLQNFIELTKQGSIWRDLWTTIKFAVTVSVILNFFGLILALLLEKSNTINGIYRTIFFIPVLLSEISTAYIFRGIYNPDGLINQFLQFITQSDFKLNMLGNFTFVIYLVAFAQAWKWIGFSILIYVSGLTTIPQELIEAAKIEGASELSIIRNIKLPLLGPAFTYNISLSIIGSMSAFGLILALTRGGPGSASEVLNLLILRNFSSGQLGYATAISLLLFIVILCIGVPIIIFLRRREVQL